MEPTNTDILISRIVDDEATSKDWESFEQLAALEPDVWKKLAREQRDAANLRSAVGAAVEAADAIELPLDIAGAGAEHVFSRRFSPWIGWAMAAAVALAWLGADLVPTINTDLTPTNQAGIDFIPASADDALNQYREVGEQEGRYIGEMPKIMVEARTMPDGNRVEVIYLRQLLEREIVNGVYGLGEDDQGRATPVPIEPRVIQASDPI